jgi:hypothetical protein
VRCDSERLRGAVGARLLGPAWFKLGEARLRQGEKAGAVDAFRTCATRFPGEAAAVECVKRLDVLGEPLRIDEISSGG